MNAKEAYKLGMLRGAKSAQAATLTPSCKAWCGCDKGEMCEVCVSFAANTEEEYDRKRKKSDWHEVIKEIRANRNPVTIEEAFEEGVIAGLHQEVTKIIEAHSKNQARSVEDKI